MAKIALRHTADIETKDRYTKVEFELGMTMEGRELPNAAVLGTAMEDAVKLIQERVKQSYEVVPPRPDGVPVNATENPAFIRHS